LIPRQPGGTAVRLAQFRPFENPVKKFAVAKAIVAAEVANQFDMLSVISVTIPALQGKKS